VLIIIARSKKMAQWLAGATEILESCPPAGYFSQISAGNSHTCGIKTNGTIVCWGDKSSGKTTPPGGSFTQVSAGANHTCAVNTHGTLACWGNNDYNKVTYPGGTFIQLSAGQNHTCAVKSDGSLACWGYNGNGETAYPGGTFTKISAGWNHSCAVKTDGSLACWGKNDYGKATPPEGTFLDVSVGESHTCALRHDATVACWGHNDSNRATPPLGTFSQIAVGQNHACAASTDGTIVCWGYNQYNKAMPPAIMLKMESGQTPPGPIGPSNCADDHAVYSVTQKTLTIPVIEVPLVTIFGDSSQVEMFKAVLKFVSDTGDSFTLKVISKINVQPGSSCGAAKYSVEEGTVHIPYVDVPLVASVGNSTHGTAIYDVTLKWHPLVANTFMILDAKQRQ
jgi:hypothetical protein